MYTEVSSAEILIIVALWFSLKKNLAGTKKASRKCPFCNSVLRRRATAILFKSNRLCGKSLWRGAEFLKAV